MAHPTVHQHIKLQVAHHGIQLHHTVRDRRTRGKSDPFSAGQLVHVAAFPEHITGLLRFCLVDTCYIPHFCVHKEVFVVMCLVHKKPVNTQFLKGDGIILLLVVQLFQLRLQIELCFLHLFDAPLIAVFQLGLPDSGHNFVNLILNHRFLPLRGKRDFFKLAVADHNGVIVAGGDLGTELLAFGRGKIFLGGNQHLCAGIQFQKIAAPLFGQMVRDNKKRFLIQPQALALHSGGNHFKGLARADTVSQQRISAVKHPRYGVALMRFQLVLRVHSGKLDMISVVFAGPDRVKQAVIGSAQVGAALRVLENPVTERFANGLLLLLGDHGFFLIQNTLFFSIDSNQIIYP